MTKNRQIWIKIKQNLKQSWKQNPVYYSVVYTQLAGKEITQNIAYRNKQMGNVNDKWME